MKKKQVLLLALLIALVPAGFWFFGDEELDEGARQWQAWHEERAGQPREGYLYQLGLDGPVGMDPVSAGEQWYRAFREEYAETTNPLVSGTEPPWAGHRLPMPDRGQLEVLAGCVSDPDLHCNGLDRMLEQHALLLQRYKSWPVERGFEVSAPDLVLVPRLEVIVAGGQLAWLEAEQALIAGESEHAAELIVALVDKLRAYLEQADSLLQMVMAIRLISDQVERLVILSNNDQWVALELDVDDLLRDVRAPDEMLERVMRGEFGLISYSMDWLYDNPESSNGLLNDWIFRLLHRKNIAINTSHDLYRWVAGIDKPVEVSAISNGSVPAWTSPFSLRNYWSTLHPTHLPGQAPFLTYVARLHDLKAKLALARAYLADPSIDDAALERLVRINPYGRGYGIDLDQPKSRLCLAGPLEDRTGIRCVPVLE